MFVLILILLFYKTIKNLAKHSTDYKNDDNESVIDSNEDIKDDIDKKQKGEYIFLSILCK